MVEKPAEQPLLLLVEENGQVNLAKNLHEISGVPLERLTQGSPDWRTSGKDNTSSRIGRPYGTLVGKIDRFSKTRDIVLGQL